jgi:hypothetical protein
MKIKFRITALSFLTLAIFHLSAKSQTIDGPPVKPVLFDGLIVAGYIDHGAYINCAGPAVKFTKKPLTLLLGLLPGLRIKKDNAPAGAPKNAIVTPSLGLGLTAVYKHLALQAPLYYNSKTSTKDGRWIAGIGLGYKF